MSESDVQRKKWFLFMACGKNCSSSREVLRDRRVLMVHSESLGQALDLARNMALVQGLKVVLKKDVYEYFLGFHDDMSSPDPFHTGVEEGANCQDFAVAGYELGIKVALALSAVEESQVNAVG